MLSTMFPTHSVIAAVGSDSNGLYVEVSARWDLPSAFSVAGASDKYRLTIGGAEGRFCSGSHNNQQFSTYDTSDNDGIT